MALIRLAGTPTLKVPCDLATVRDMLVNELDRSLLMDKKKTRMAHEVAALIAKISPSL
jgi:hypothetical protein